MFLKSYHYIPYFIGILYLCTDYLKDMKKIAVFLLSLFCTCVCVNADDGDSLTVSPYLYKVIGPNVYRSEAVKRAFRLTPVQADRGIGAGFAYRNSLDSLIDAELFKCYVEHPKLFDYHDGMVESEELVSATEGVKTATVAVDDKAVKDILAVDAGNHDVADLVGPLDIGLEIEKPNFWKTRGEFGLQYTQNYFSEMWYKGANNNMTFLGTLLLEANYNDQKRIQWDNKLEMRLGFINSKSDTVHNFMPSDNKLYLMSKLGVKAYKEFYYTVQGEAQTQILPGYKVNDTVRYSMFLAPLDVFLSIGMDYKPKLKNNNTLSVALLPLSYKLRYVSGGDDVVIKEYKLRDGLRHQNDFGSKLEANCKFTIVKNLVWKSRLYYYTTYKYVEAEWENSLTYSFSRYLQSEIYTLWRFDDNRDKKYWDEKLGFFQFKEYFTLGLAYKF